MDTKEFIKMVDDLEPSKDLIFKSGRGITQISKMSGMMFIHSGVVTVMFDKLEISEGTNDTVHLRLDKKLMASMRITKDFKLVNEEEV